MGGYFFVYVILSLLLFAILVRRNRDRQARIAAARSVHPFCSAYAMLLRTVCW
jgi:Na+/proline symporter